jgi:hypothetical protein
LTTLGYDPNMFGEGPDKSGGVQITTIKMITGHVWSKTGHVQKTSLEFGEGTRQVQWTGVVLE